jgi:quercetin dioxygenase-like cupin family protein
MSSPAPPRPIVKPLEAEPSRISPQTRFIGYCEVHDVATALQSAQHLEVNALRFEAGARSRPHRHNRDQIILFTDGPGFVAVDGSDDQPVQAGEFVMLPAGVPHMHGAPASGPAVHISIMVRDHDSDFDCPIPAVWESFREGRPAE